MSGVDRVLLVPGYCYSQFRDDGRGYCYSQFLGRYAHPCAPTTFGPPAHHDERRGRHSGASNSSSFRHSGAANSSSFRHSGAANSRTRNPGVFITHLIKSLLLILITTPLLADYQTGLDAYTSGNYNKALLEWKTATTLESTGNTHAETQYAIGMLYWLGQGVTKDYFKASEWMHKAGDQGHAGAQAKLGFLYSQGIAVKEDKNQAFNWFSKAAKQGDVDGQYNLGIFYLNGWGTKQNQTMAAQYLAAAAAQGDESAEYEVQKLVDQIAQNKTQTTPKTKSEIPDLVRHDNNLAKEAPNQVRHDESSNFLTSTWIQQQKPDNYTIQVIGLSSKADLEKLLRGHDNLAPLASFTLRRSGKPLHMLIQGNYPDVDSARYARDNFPTSVQKHKQLWIRQFTKIQQLIRAETGGQNE